MSLRHCCVEPRFSALSGLRARRSCCGPFHANWSILMSALIAHCVSGWRPRARIPRQHKPTNTNYSSAFAARRPSQSGRLTESRFSCRSNSRGRGLFTFVFFNVSRRLHFILFSLLSSAPIGQRPPAPPFTDSAVTVRERTLCCITDFEWGWSRALILVVWRFPLRSPEDSLVLINTP
ncbi:hypothetical protein MHYP_G00033810 [Metynnis hypsauchen]